MTARRKRVVFAALSATAALLLTGCRDSLPQSGLNPAGDNAEKIFDLFTPIFWIAVGVFVVVEGLLVVALVRFRHRPGRAVPPQIHGNRVMEIAWTIAPAALLAFVAVPTVATIFGLAQPPSGNYLQVNVTGHQWWWDVDYPQLDVRTANEIHVPTGRQIYVVLHSVDVIHSFWVPRLAGKQDLEPGHTNVMTLNATQPGVYPGQCAEYCGTSHADMRFRVIAQTPADFDAWVAQQLQPAGVQPPANVLQTLQSGGCQGCHTIGGLEGFIGEVGPNLTHFGGRETFAGGTYENTPENLAAWLRNPQALKPDNDMKLPRRLSEDEIRALVAYLRSLT